ncbi:MAG: multidrug efflux SMR transporter [Betaproteobacteria bacterium]|nr:multidrug efflux SMR transporter [Betaproteobacteria bacterium]
MIDFRPSVPQAWGLLAAAIAFEVGGTTCMKLSDGLQRVGPSVVMFACYAVAFSLNTVVVRTLDLSVTYAVWSGVGTALTAAIGIGYFREPATAIKLASLGLIVIGVIGLHAASRPAPA